MKNATMKFGHFCMSVIILFTISCNDDRETLDQLLSDTEAPTSPTGLSASNIKTETLQLSWEAATDNVKVTNYEVFQDGESVGLSGGNTMLELSGLIANTSYEFSVKALDGEDNTSSMSDSITVTTANDEDTEKPSTPTGLEASNITASSVELSWEASTDNEAVSEYEVFQDGVSIGTTSETTMEITGLELETSYEFTVMAMDASGNTSELSDVLTVNTSAETITDSVIDIIVARDDLSTLQSVLENIGLDSSLEENGPFTVLAPNNAAFTAYGTLPSGVLLNRLVVNHVVEGNFTAQELIAEAVVVNGLNEDITITEDGSGNIILNGAAKIIVKDIKATNGIIHVIDKIIPLAE